MSELKNKYMNWDSIKFVLGLILIIILIQFIPNSILFNISILFVGIPIVAYIIGIYLEKRFYKFIKLSIEKEGYKLISIKPYSEYHGVRFEYKNKKYYAKFKANSFRNIGVWIDGTPREIVEKTSL